MVFKLLGLGNWKVGHSGQDGTGKRKDKKLHCCLDREVNTPQTEQNLYYDLWLKEILLY